MAEYIRTGRPANGQQEALLAAWLQPWAIPDLDTAEEHQAHLLAAGFAEGKLQDVTTHVRISLRNLYELCLRWLPVGRFLHRLGLVSTVRLRNAQASVHQYEALQTGAWWYGLLLAKKSPAPENRSGAK